jgi:hypothetical protein
LDGVESLSSITARASSARVLDLHAIANAAFDEPEHETRPLFVHPVLNRTIIVKHHPRGGEFDHDAGASAIVTKVIFPFDGADLDLGGLFLLAGAADLAVQLARRLTYASADELQRDLTVLRLIDSLPTLDPFLLAEALGAARYDVAPCYFRLSDADRGEMLAFVAGQVEALIALCFDEGGDHGGHAERLSKVLLAEGDGPELEPLRQALRMEGSDFARAMFCWKAVLYYRWRSRALAPDLKATHRGIRELDAGKLRPETRRFVETVKDELLALLSDGERRIAEGFRDYDAVYKALTVKRSPEPFRQFLIGGPRLFARLGERMGRLEQLVSYWEHCFGEARGRDLKPEALIDGLRGVQSALSLKSAVFDLDGLSTATVWGAEGLDAPAKADASEPEAA